MEKLSKKKSHWEGRILWKRTDGENQEQGSRPTYVKSIRNRPDYLDRPGVRSGDLW